MHEHRFRAHSAVGNQHSALGQAAHQIHHRWACRTLFFQVGLLTTIGLSAKNAILIVEFAKESFEKGMNLVEAAKYAAAQRLRPIRSPLGTFPSVELTPVAVHLTVVFMGDKSPKATSKAAAQKQAKAAAASQKKNDVASAKQVPKK